MHGENALDLDSRLALVCHRALNMLRRENDVSIFLALQNVLVHFLVATVAAALAAGGVHNKFASGGAGSIVKLYAAALQTKVAVNGVERGIHGEVDFGLGWIKRESFLLRLRDPAREQRKKNEECGMSKSTNGQAHVRLSCCKAIVMLLGSYNLQATRIERVFVRW